MALRIRRGTDLERIGIVFVEGELVYSTDTKRLYIGDGVTAGGVSVSDLINDTSPQLGADIDLNGQDIVGFGNINISGDISATGTLTIPTIITDVTGSIFGDDSQPLVDGANSKLVLDNNVLSDLPDVDAENPANDDVLRYSASSSTWIPTNSITASIQGVNGQVLVSRTSENVYLGNNSIEDLKDISYPGTIYPGDVLKWDSSTNKWIPGPVVPNVLTLSTITISDTATIDTLTATNTTVDTLEVNTTIHTPFIEALTIEASLIGTDSSVLIDHVTGIGYIDIQGDVIGDVIGNVTGDVFGNVTGDLTGDVFGNVTGDLTGDVSGNVSGNLTGNVIASIVTSDSLTTQLIAVPAKNLEIVDSTGVNGFWYIRVRGQGQTRFQLNYNRSDLDLSGAGNDHGRLDFTRSDLNGEDITDAFIKGGTDGFKFFCRGPIQNFPATARVYIQEDGSLSIGTDIATARLTVDGDAAFGGPVNLGTYADSTARDADITSPAAGMIIFLLDDGSQGGSPAVPKFQGYDGSGWVNLS
jgi:hypothetical protein